LRLLGLLKASVFEGFMKKEGFKMEESDDKPFQCTAPGCGQVRLSASCSCV